MILLLQYTSALVTYVIVLLQFDMGKSSYLQVNGTQNSNNSMKI